MKKLFVFLLLALSFGFAQGISDNPRDYFVSIASLGGLVAAVITFIRGVIPALDGAARVRTTSILLGILFALIGKAANWFGGGWAEAIVFGLSAGASGFGLVDLGRTIAKGGAPSVRSLSALGAVTSLQPPNLIQTVISALGAAVSAFWPESRPYYNMIKDFLLSMGGRITTQVEGDEISQIVMKDLYEFAQRIKGAESEEAQRAIAATMLGELTIQLNNRFPLKGV
jgi:hypothetical protein